jgi:hypothetical protein
MQQALLVTEQNIKTIESDMMLIGFMLPSDYGEYGALEEHLTAISSGASF